jgi:hypothetical protein
VLVGNQDPASGEIDWVWSLFIWPEYTWDIDGTVEESSYVMSLSEGDAVQYQHAGGHDSPHTEAEYTHIPVEPYHRQ